jgi:hypothetical protein
MCFLSARCITLIIISPVQIVLIDAGQLLIQSLQVVVTLRSIRVWIYVIIEFIPEPDTVLRFDLLQKSR